MKKRIITLLAVVALLVTCAVFTANAAVDTSGDWTCPCCDQAYDDIEWITFGTLRTGETKGQYDFTRTCADGSKHYLVDKAWTGLGSGATLTGDTTNSKIVVLMGMADNSAMIFGSGKANVRAFTISANTEAWIIGDGNVTIASALLTGTSATANGGLVYVNSGATLHLSGVKLTGRINSGASVSVGTPYRGGIIYNNSGNMYIDDVEIDASVITSVNRGGAIYTIGGTVQITDSTIKGAQTSQHGGTFVTTSTMTIKDSTVSGGVTTGSGGNFYATSGTLTLEGTTVSGGQAANGGNIHAYGGTVIIKNSTTNNALIQNGTATANGGNIYANNDVDVAGGSITGGNSTVAEIGTTRLGGNVYVAKGTFDVTGGSISSGKAYRGGNVYFADGTSNVGVIEMTLGDATMGGNVFVADGTVTLQGTTLDGANVSSTDGGNIYQYAGTLNLGGTATNKTVVRNGTVTNQGGNIYVGNGDEETATLNIKPHTDILDGDADNYGGNIYANASAVIAMTGGNISGGEGDKNNTVHKIFDGDNVYMRAGSSMTVTSGTIEAVKQNREWTETQTKHNVVGAAIDCRGTLVLGGDAEIINEDKFGAIYVPGAATLTVQAGFSGNASAYIEGHVTFADGEDAIGYGKDFDAKVTCTGAFTGKLYVESTSSMGIKAEPQVLRKGETTTLTVAGASISSKDAGADTYSRSWYVDTAAAEAAQDAAKDYVALTANGLTTYHEVSVAITGISLRPGTAGIYYTAELECDDTIAPELTYGVAVNVGANGISADLSNAAYTEANGKTDGKKANSMLVDKILYKEGKVDKVTQDRADMVINAQAYISYNDAYIMSAAKNYSLTTLLEAFADRYEDANAPTAAQKLVLKNFCTTYTDINAELWSDNEKIATIKNYEEV